MEDFFGDDARSVSERRFAINVASEERLAFIKKVYGLLFLGLISAAVGAFVGLLPSVVSIIATGYIVLFLVWIGTLLLAHVFRRVEGINYLLLFSFTFLSGLIIAPMLFMYVLGGQTDAIFSALIIAGTVRAQCFPDG